MNYKYQFGDRVRHTVHGEGVITALYFEGSDLEIEALFLDDSFGAFPAHEFQPVPHPDTARLDWLVKNDCSLTERLCDEDGDRLDTPFAVIQKVGEHFELLAAAWDIREAIDAAMWESKNEAH